MNDSDPEIVVEVSDMGVMLNGSAKVIATDIVGTNGVIHVIDQVILPIANGSILDAAMGMADFISLVAALAKANLASTFMMDGAYTVFAPTNDAFAAFLASINVSFEDLNADDLSPILQYHVVSGNVRSTDLVEGDVETLNGSFSLSLAGPVTINGSTEVVATDVQGTNGVVHVIDEVLLP